MKSQTDRKIRLYSAGLLRIEINSKLHQHQDQHPHKYRHNNFSHPDFLSCFHNSTDITGKWYCSNPGFPTDSDYNQDT